MKADGESRMVKLNVNLSDPKSKQNTKKPEWSSTKGDISAIIFLVNDLEKVG